MRNAAGELFGEERLTQCVENNRTVSPEDLANAIRAAVFAFAGSETPNDDLTCVVIRMVESERPQASGSLVIRSDFHELGRAREFIRSFCSASFDKNAIAQIELAVTEAC